MVNQQADARGDPAIGVDPQHIPTVSGPMTAMDYSGGLWELLSQTTQALNRIDASVGQIMVHTAPAAEVKSEPECIDDLARHIVGQALSLETEIEAIKGRLGHPIAAID